MSDKSSTPKVYEKCVLYRHCNNYTPDVMCFDCWCKHDKAVEIFKQGEEMKNG